MVSLITEFRLILILNSFPLLVYHLFDILAARFNSQNTFNYIFP